MENLESNLQKELKEKQKKLLLGCAGSLQEALGVLEDLKESETKKKTVQNLLEIALEANSAGHLPDYFLEKLKYTTLATIEMVFFDEMVRDVESVPIYKRRYGREHPVAYESFAKEWTEEGKNNPLVLSVFLDSGTLARDMESLAEAAKNPNMRVGAYLGDDCDQREKGRTSNEKLSLILCEDTSQLETILQEEKKKLVVIPGEIGEGEEDEHVCDVIHQFLEKPDFQNIVVARFKITDSVGVMQVFQGNKLRIRSKIFSHLNLTKQEELLALLESGRSFLTINEVDEEDLKKEKEKKIAKPNQEELNCKLEEYIKSLANLEEKIADRYYRRKMVTYLRKEGLDGFLKKHENRYKRFFSKEGREPEEILLTNSGLSANNLAIKAVADQSSEKIKAYYQVGWYYDNVKIIKDFFEVVEKTEDAKILFVNTDSCYPDEPGKFHSEQTRLISDFVQKAKQYPDSEYTLVVDVTTDMLWGEQFEIPKNLQLIQTFSATKHQHGGRNYFFGGVASWNTEGLREKMESNLDFLGGRLTSVGVVNYPRITKGEIRKNMEHMKKLSVAFKKGVEKGATMFPEELSFKVYPYNYYTYVVLPPGFPRYPFLDAHELEFDGLAEEGDSFGLEHTRVCFVPKSVREDENALRFSPGFKETEERMYKLGLKLNLEWRKFILKLKEEIEKEKN